MFKIQNSCAIIIKVGRYVQAIHLSDRSTERTCSRHNIPDKNWIHWFHSWYFQVDQPDGAYSYSNKLTILMFNFVNLIIRYIKMNHAHKMIAEASISQSI